MINKDLLDILACPLCKTDVRLEENKIVCTKCGRKYPVKDEIPVMLIDEAELPEEQKGN
ncbi:MAG: Trm112 family protein [Candidatus Loosdrechtia sp.]|uniref:Trm112 family protein n=1 Tax=Candidatus Loosdrechtia sp. TaxID=3101272 RepID=UPI003A682D34|nr:MAG: Trm112 family protein [Candidatus Jettenia sp. AMX2]